MTPLDHFSMEVEGIRMELEDTWAWLEGERERLEEESTKMESVDELERMVWALLGNDYSFQLMPVTKVQPNYIEMEKERLAQEQTELEQQKEYEREAKWTRQVRLRK
jgi:hypothetical protein